MKNKQQLFQALPGVDKLLCKTSRDPRFNNFPRSIITSSIRKILEDLRQDICQNLTVDINCDSIMDKVVHLVRKRCNPKLNPVINATGVILHTNLGRSPLCSKAIENIINIARGYSNLEFNLAEGKRGLRYTAVEEILCDLTGADAAMVVNNNAGAVLLAINSLARGTQVVVSRGELVEIGGSFRIPDIMAQSGCILKEIGTTNRTHIKDYANALNEDTGLLLKVHTSNYKIQGFTKEVPVCDLAELGRKNGVPVMNDLGSGSLVDFSRYNLPDEPLISDQIEAGANIVTFSGDKLLGGPQAGIIVGDKNLIKKIRENPLARALRIDKLTLAALEPTLSFYTDKSIALKELPTLRMLTMTAEETRERSTELAGIIKKQIKSDIDIQIQKTYSRPGGGSFPEALLSGFCVSITIPGMTAQELEKSMRNSSPGIIGRIEEDKYIMDPRTIDSGQAAIIAKTIEDIL